MRTTVLAICFFLPSLLPAQSLLVDGFFEDWASLPTAYTDPSGDAGNSGVDFTTLKITHDETFLFIRFNTTAEVVLQEGNTLRLYIDTDFDASTGQQLQGLGAELMWNFAGRMGTVRLGTSTRTINHADIGLYPAPTYSSTQFEIALRRDARIGGQPLFTGDSVRVALAVIEAGGDRVPDADGVAYGFDGGGLPAAYELLLGKTAPAAVRVLTWNTLQDGLVDGDRQPAFARVLRAVQPDIMCFQECFDASAGQVLLFVRSAVDPPAGRSWRTLKIDQGNVLITHYDIEDSWVLQNNYRESAYLLASPEGKKLLLINCHFRCCSANEERQQEADGVIRFLRDAKSPGGKVTLEQGTPMVLVGDLNLVGDRRQLETLRTGDIEDNARYGADEAPDWDGGDWTECVSRQPRTRVTHTWENPFSSYAPSVLDYVLYTASAMTIAGNMVIKTSDMSAAERQRLVLQADDSEEASDHYPRYVDLVWKDATDVPPVADAVPLAIDALWPQPADGTLQLRLRSGGQPVAVTITDLLGREVYRATAAARAREGIDVSSLRPGPYLLRVTDGVQRSERMIIVQ